MRIFASILAGLVSASSIQAEPTVEVMILGTYHMANPGLDLHNAKADDVLTPGRQEELQAVVDGLARFKPTRVAVEWDADDKPMRALPAYHDFLDGKRDESRNEIDQVAFRLARKMQLEEVYGIDADGNFPYEDVKSYAKKAGKLGELERLSTETERKVRAFEAQQRTSSIGQLLRTMNTPQAIRDDASFYMSMLSMGDGDDQPGAELVGQWTMRNLKICARLVQTVQSGDRVVVVYGAGHSSLLRQCVIDLPDWKLVEPNDYLPE